MANKLYEENDIAAIATVIRNKNGSSDTYTVSEMAQAINDLPGARNVVNGIIKQYKSSTSTINADTFVEFVVGEFGEGLGPDTLLLRSNTLNPNAGADPTTALSAVALDSNRVYLTCHSETFFGVVLSVSNDAITMGTPVEVSPGITGASSSSSESQTELIDTNKVFVLFYGDDPNVEGRYKDALYGVVCTISGTAITPGAPVMIYGNDECNSGRIAKLSPTSVFVGFYQTTLRELYGVLCTVSGTAITINTPVSIYSSGSWPQNGFTVTAISNTRVFVTTSPGSQTKVYGFQCDISSSNAITPYAAVDLTPNGGGRGVSCVALGSQRVFVAHGMGNSTGIYAQVCTCSGTTVTPGTETFIGGTQTAQAAYTIKLDENTVYVYYGAYGEDNYHGVVCGVSGTTITPGVEEIYQPELRPDKMRIQTPVDDNFALSFYYASYQLHARTVRKGVTVKPTVNKIDGLTKTDCTTTTAGQVWVLDNS